MFKVNYETPKRRHWRRFSVFIVNFEHISHLVLVYLLLTYQLNTGWVMWKRLNPSYCTNMTSHGRSVTSL